MYTLFVDCIEICHSDTFAFSLAVYGKALASLSNGVWCIVNQDNKILFGNVSE